MNRALPLDKHLWMGKAYAHKHMHQEATAALQKAARLLPESVFSGALGYTYAAAGRRADAEEYVRHLETLSAEQYLEPYNRAAIFAAWETPSARSSGWSARTMIDLAREFRHRRSSVRFAPYRRAI